MADYDVQRTLWTNPATNNGMWNAAQRCWETSAQTFAVVGERLVAYRTRIKDIAGEIDEVQQEIDSLPIDDPQRPLLEAKKARLQLEMALCQRREENLSGLSATDFLWKGNTDKRDVLAILENSVVRMALMHDDPKAIRRDPNYGVVSGRFRFLRPDDDTTQKWCAVQGEDGQWLAQQKDVHPMVIDSKMLSSQIPLLSTSLIEQALQKEFLQGATTKPYFDTSTIKSESPIFNTQYFSPWGALCAITMPSSINYDAIVPFFSGPPYASKPMIAQLPRNLGQNWGAPASLWLDNKTAFNGEISALQYIGNFDVLERCGWGGNGQWISGLTNLDDPSSTLTVKTDEDFQIQYAEWYNLKSRYVGYGITTSQPVSPQTYYYYDKDFMLPYAHIVKTRRLGEYDYDTGNEISTFWGIFVPETPSVWPRDNQNNIGHTSPNAMDIYTSYWNLSKLDTLAHWISYRQNQVWWQITGNAYIETPGGRSTDPVVLSNHLSGISDQEWLRTVEGISWLNFKTKFFDPYTNLTKKTTDSSGWTTEAGCLFRGTAVGNWQELSGNYDHATCWYWNDMFDRYGDVLGVWYIVPVAGYSANWKTWLDLDTGRTMMRFNHLDVKITIFAVRADTAQDQTTKSWRAYMGNAFWRRVNQIYWEDCLPSAPPAPTFPDKDDPTHPNHYSIHTVKCLGPTMAVVKYRWRSAGDDDGVHYIPLDLPPPKYTWQKPWENEEEEESQND